MLVVSLAVAAACGTRDEVGWTPSVTADSAGVTLVTHFAPRHSVEAFSEQAELTGSWSGTADGLPVAEVTGAALMSNGQVAMVDGMSRQVLLLQTDGSHRVIARQGGGPGEVMSTSDLQVLSSDSIQIYDRLNGRISVWDGDGTFAYDVRLPSSGMPPVSVRRVQDSLLLVVSRDAERQTVTSRSAAASLRTTPLLALLYSLEGEQLGEIAQMPGYADIDMGHTSLAPVFGVSAPFSVSASGVLAFGPGDLPAFTSINLRDGTRSDHRFATARQPVLRSDISRLLVQDQPPSAGMPAPGGIDDVLLEFLPDSQPAYKSIRVSEAGAVWLGSAEPLRQPSRTWQVVSPERQWVARVVLPEDAHLLHVGDSALVLRRRGPLDVPAVEVYRIQLPAP